MRGFVSGMMSGDPGYPEFSPVKLELRISTAIPGSPAAPSDVGCAIK